MKYFLILSICIFSGSSSAMKKKWLGQHENLQREIFIRAFYRDYSFELINQIAAQVTHPITQKVLNFLLVQGRQKYGNLSNQWKDENAQTV